MRRIRMALTRFMAGRYGGNDALGRFLIIAYAVVLLSNLLIRNVLVSSLALALAAYQIFRIFSRNYSARVKENQLFLRWKGKFPQWWKLQKNKWRDRKTHVYVKCPHCKSVVRLPKKKGDHGVRCPCCRRDFRVKI